jgi:hypothetical protein
MICEGSLDKSEFNIKKTIFLGEKGGIFLLLNSLEENTNKVNEITLLKSISSE